MAERTPRRADREGMKRFICYRPNPPDGYRESGAANAPDEPQFEGVVFSDGTVCVRWLTEFRSHSIWSSWADLEKIHGHPEYGTRIDWLDPTPAERDRWRQLAIDWLASYGDDEPQQASAFRFCFADLLDGAS